MSRFMVTTFVLLIAIACCAPRCGAAGGLNVVVILDNSGSMNERMRGGGTRIEAAKKSLLTVLQQTPVDAAVGVLLLNRVRGERWLVPLGPVDQGTIGGAVKQLTARGSTPLGECMKIAADTLLERRDEQRYGTYKLLVVSDGEANDADLVDKYLPQVQARGVLVDVIGVDMANRHSLATRANTYRSADDPASLEQAMSAVVLGESSGDGTGDADQSDFDILAPIPSEVAAASLAAMANVSNDPIGQDGFAADVGVPAPNQGPPQGPQPNAGGGGNDGGGWSMSRVVIGVIVLLLIMQVVSAINKAR